MLDIDCGTILNTSRLCGEEAHWQPDCQKPDDDMPFLKRGRNGVVGVEALVREKRPTHLWVSVLG